MSQTGEVGNSKAIFKPFKANPLFFSFLLPLVTDTIVTLLGQDASYYQSYNTANELGPAYFFLTTHPIIYILGAIVWITFLYWLVKRLKHPLNMMLAFGFMVGHGWGSSTWFTRWLGNAGFLNTTNRALVLLSWMLMVFYFGLIGVCAGLS